MNKEEFLVIVKEAGFKSLRQFALEAGIDVANLNTNLNGTYSIQIDRMFKIADTLKVSIDEVVEMFYPERYAKNDEIVREANNG
jgi:transcriptional regulator with XRE-family HTH domain